MGSLTLSLAQPQLLSESFDVLVNASGSNGAGGRAGDVWTVEETLRGRAYQAKIRASSEPQSGGKSVDTDMTEIALDSSTVDPSRRLRNTATLATYEIVGVTSGPVTIVRARLLR